MTNRLYKWYATTKKLLKEMECASPEEKEEMQCTINDWNEIIKHMEENEPDIKNTYERRLAAEKSFTTEQIDHICYQIGEWYIEWENKMWIGDKPNLHWLWVAKEQLKTMICGD